MKAAILTVTWNPGTSYLFFPLFNVLLYLAKSSPERCVKRLNLASARLKLERMSLFVNDLINNLVAYTGLTDARGLAWGG